MLNNNHGCLNLENVLVVPDIKKNLLSIRKLTTNNLYLFFSHQMDKQGKTLAKRNKQ